MTGVALTVSGGRDTVPVKDAPVVVTPRRDNGQRGP